MSTHQKRLLTHILMSLSRTQELRREHDMLKREVASLESKVAELQAMHDRLKAQAKDVGVDL